MNKYPFIYLDHGKITSGSFLSNGINETAFILFKTVISENERKKIMEECPMDLKGGCFWGKCFLFFNPSSCEIPEEIMKMDHEMEYERKDFYVNKDDEEDRCIELLLSGIPIRALEIDTWFCKVNGISEIAACCSPFIPEEEDGWGEWSNDNAYDMAIPVIDRFLEADKDIAKCDNEESEYFFRIHEHILNYDNGTGAERNERWKNIRFSI